RMAAAPCRRAAETTAGHPPASDRNLWRGASGIHGFRPDHHSDARRPTLRPPGDELGSVGDAKRYVPHTAPAWTADSRRHLLDVSGDRARVPAACRNVLS